MINSLEILHIDHPLCSATILLQGAQLISWIPLGSSDILWSSDIVHYKAGKAFRGGIPICWPWFGKTYSPAHGFARLMSWELVRHDDGNDGVHLEFRLTDTPQSIAIWPHPFALSLQMHLGTTCEIRLNIEAPISTTGALHTYLATTDIAHSFITGLGSHYIDSLQENTMISTEESSLQIHSEVDRIYIHGESENILTTPKQILRLTHQRHSDIVVWNPWIKRSAEISDMNTNDYCHMVCIETARINKKFASKDSIGLGMEII